MTKRDLVVASTRHHHARLLKYYPRRQCAPSLIKSRFSPHTTNLLTVLTFLIFKFLVCIQVGNPKVPPRVLASGPKPCGGNKLLKKYNTFHPIICKSKKKTNFFCFLTTFFKTARFEHENEMRRKALRHTQKNLESSPFGNPESTELESGIQYPESGIHSVESRIH